MRRTLRRRPGFAIAALAIPIFFPVGLPLDLAVLAASLFEVEKHSPHTADARRFPISDAFRLTSAQSEKN